MLFLKRGLTVAGTLALAAMLLNFVAPRAAHALVATAVQVMNTSDAPVMTRDVDRAGSKALVLQCTAAASDTCTTPPPPDGYTFVLDSLSIYAEAVTHITYDPSPYKPPTLAVITFNAPSPSQYTVHIPLTQGVTNLPPTMGAPNDTLIYQSFATQNLTAYLHNHYIDPNNPTTGGTLMPISVSVSGESGPLASFSVVFVGHLVGTT
jgi:hypothetical protein